MEKLDMQSPDFTNQNIQKLVELFPNCVTEARDNKGVSQQVIDFDLLKQELSNNIVDGQRERYQLNWPGKREALLTANTPIEKTLRPDRDESVDFDVTENLFIEGDNLDALKLLQETYLGKIKMIYIDPPYNTGRDFIYSDNFSMDSEDYLVTTSQKSSEGGRLIANPDANGRFHSDWLSMIYSRLKLARNLLSEDGVVFISIDDNEQANLKRLCDEVFGENNFLGAAGSTFPPDRPNLGDGIWRWTRSKIEAESEKLVVKPVKSSNLVTEDGSPAKWNVFTKTYLSDVISNASAKPNSLIEGLINQMGSHEIKALDIPFDFSKPSALIKYLIEISRSDSNSIIMDFFGGSGTTAQAVMQQNMEDNGNRKFIMVQLPEITDENSEAYKAGYFNIAEISKERIRRAGKKIKEENADKEGIDNLDIGFRVLKVDSSNMKDVYYAPDAIGQADLEEQTNNIKDDRSSEDLLFQVLLDWGVDLTLAISKETIEDKTVFFVANNALAACFEKDVSEALVKALAKREPLRAVFRDSGYSNDSTKINIEQIFKLTSPATEVKAI